MRLGSRDPLVPDDPKAPRPLAGGIVRKGTGPLGGGIVRKGTGPGAVTPETKVTVGSPSGPGPADARHEPRAPAAPPRAKPGSVKPAPGKKPALPAGRAYETPMERPGEPSLALIECASIAVGFRIADEVVKKAPVRLLRAQTASPGKFLVLFAGDVASVEEAHKAGLAAAGDTLLDALFLPHAHPTVLPALEALTATSHLDSFAAIETFSLASAIVAADAAVKAAPVALIEIRPPVGLGGKSFFTLTGGLEDLQAAVASALDRIRPGGMICRHVVIPNPHGDLSPFVF